MGGQRIWRQVLKPARLESECAKVLRLTQLLHSFRLTVEQILKTCSFTLGAAISVPLWPATWIGGVLLH